MPTDPQALELRDIHLPDPVSWWPPALGWWMVLLVTLLFVIILFWLRKRWLEKKRSAKVIARQELGLIQKKYQQQPDQHQLVEDLSVLLRRACLSVFPREDSAGLTGEKWLGFLDDVMKDKQFLEGAGRSLITAPYKKEPRINAEQLIAVCKDWIEALP